MKRLERYIDELRGALPRDFGGRYTTRILQEIEGYLLDSTAAGRDAGLSEDDALRQAIERCGKPAVIAEGFQQIVQTRRARRIHQGLWPLLAICFGLIGLTVWRYPAVVGTSHAIVSALILLRHPVRRIRLVCHSLSRPGGGCALARRSRRTDCRPPGHDNAVDLTRSGNVAVEAIGDARLFDSRR